MKLLFLAEQRIRQLQDEASQLRERLGLERRTTEKAHQQVACLMQRMEALRRHRAQTEARASRQGQVSRVCAKLRTSGSCMGLNPQG